MNELTVERESYMVSVHEPEDGTGSLIFTFVAKGAQQVRGPGITRWGPPRPVAQFVVTAHQDTGGPTFDWSGTPDDPGASRQEMEAEIAARMNARAIWIDRVTSLVGQMEQWAREMGWSTRRVEKGLEDAYVGNHRVPALLMQEDTCRVLLEPVGRSAPGADGVVDLYLLPRYDDIASLYYYGNQWNLHYMFPGSKPAATVREGESMPLSKQALERVLAELKRHAA